MLTVIALWEYEDRRALITCRLHSGGRIALCSWALPLKDMFVMRDIQFLLCLLVLYVPLAVLRAQTNIAADDPSIQYIGRFDVTTPTAPAFDLSYSCISAKFQGTSCSVKLGGTSKYFDLYVDGVRTGSIKSANGGLETLPVASGLADGVHTVALCRRDEASKGLNTFQGFVLDTGKALVAPDARPCRKLEFIGDSFTCGYGDEAAYGASFELTPRELGMGGAIAKAREIVAATPNAWLPMQFDNPANIEVHKRTTAEEIARDFPEGLDYIFAGEFIEHLYDDKKFAAECFEKLTPGGYLILTVPNLHYLLNRIMLPFGKIPFFTIAQGHYHVYTKSIIFGVLEGAGFKIGKLISSHVLFPARTNAVHLPAFLMRTLGGFFEFLGDIFPSFGGHLIIFAKKVDK